MSMWCILYFVALVGTLSAICVRYLNEQDKYWDEQIAYWDEQIAYWEDQAKYWEKQ